MPFKTFLLLIAPQWFAVELSVATMPLYIDPSGNQNL